MKPILYEAGTTNFDNNGIGRLSSCISCLVTEERNGVFECEFQYPITGKYYSEIQEGRIITISHDEQGDRQPFIIYRRSAVLGGIVTFNAHHVSYLLNNIILSPFEATSPAGAFAAISSHSMNANPFEFWTDNTTAGGTISVTVPTAVRAFLGGVRGSFLDLYGGEYEWDGYTVKNHAHRGANNGVTIRYGKNLTKLEQEVDALDLYDSVVPFWVSETDAVFGGIVTGTGQTMNLVRALDMSSYYDETPTVAQLEARAQTFLDSNKPWIPKQNIDIDFVALWQTEEYKDIAPLERVQLCDTVTVVYTDLGVQATAKVIEVVWDAILERYNKIELGDAKSSFASTILKTTEERIAEAVSGLPTTGMMEEAIDHATDLITGGLGGYIVINRDANGRPNELLIMDTPDKTTAVNVWRWNSGGLGHSHSGYNGPYDDVAITQDGKINASMITAGTMNANLIRAGIIADTQGYNFWNLATGEFKLSWNSTIGNQTIQEVIDGAGGYTLETPFRWTNNNQTANFTAVVYKGTEDVTNDFDPNWFVWTLRTEDGESQVGTGKTLTLNRSQFGYGATVTCTFTTYDDAVALRAVDGKKLKSVDGKQLKMYANQDEDVLVSDLPIKTAAEIDPTDKLMGIDDVEGYQVSITNFGDFLATSKYDARYVNVDGDTMTGDLRLQKATGYTELSFETLDGGSVSWIRAYPDSAQSVYGNNMVINPGGNLILGSGESAQVIYDNNIDSAAGGGERTYISSDNDICFYPACNTIANRSRVIINANGSIQSKRSGVFGEDDTLTATAYTSMISWTDANDNTLGYMEGSKDTNDVIWNRLVCRRHVNGSYAAHQLYLGVDASGNAKMNIGGTGAVAAWRTTLDVYSKSETDNRYVNLSGDTMTGDLVVQRATNSHIWLDSSSIDSKMGTAKPSDSVTIGSFTVRDVNNVTCGWFNVLKNTSGGIRAEIYVSRPNASGTKINHGIALVIDDSGNRSVSVHDAAAWRTALGVSHIQTKTVTGTINNQSCISLGLNRTSTVVLAMCNTGSSTAYDLSLATFSSNTNWYAHVTTTTGNANVTNGTSITILVYYMTV